MSIEQDLNRIANALEIIAGTKSLTTVEVTPLDLRGNVSESTAVEKKKTKKADKPEEAKAPTKALVTKEQLADALRELVLSQTPVVAKEILSKFGATRLSEIKETDYSAVYEALKNA